MFSADAQQKIGVVIVEDEGLYRDLLTWFDDSPVMGIGCSEIDMQWQGRYCPKCQKRVSAGATVRELLLGHAESLHGWNMNYRFLHDHKGTAYKKIGTGETA